MTATALLTNLEALGVKVTLDGEKLRFSAPKGVLTQELRTELARNKSSLVEALRVATLPEQHEPSALWLEAISQAQTIDLTRAYVARVGQPDLEILELARLVDSGNLLQALQTLALK